MMTYSTCVKQTTFSRWQEMHLKMTLFMRYTFYVYLPHIVFRFLHLKKEEEANLKYFPFGASGIKSNFQEEGFEFQASMFSKCLLQSFFAKCQKIGPVVLANQNKGQMLKIGCKNDCFKPISTER